MGFIVAANKTGASVFSFREIPANVSLTVDRATIPVKKEIKILGITLDSRLNWCKHTSVVETKCTKVLNLMRLLSGTKWGAHAKPQLSIYRALIRSTLDYGSEVIESASEQTKKKLDVIQACALRIIFGVPRATPTEVLLREAGEMPLSLRRNLASAKRLLRCYETNGPLLQEKEKWFSDGPQSFFSRTKEAAELAQLPAVEKIPVVPLPWSPPNLPQISK